MTHLRIMIQASCSRLMLAVFGTLILSTPILGQDANELLGKLSEKAQGYGSIEASYVSKLLDQTNDFEAIQNGVIQISGEKYRLDLGDYTVISDGATVWTYETAVNDCYIEDADILLEDGMNPSKLFTIWEDDFKNEWKGILSIEGQEVVQINLYPNGTKERPFHTIQLYINEKDLELVRAVVKGREGTDVTYDVEGFQSGVSLNENIFTFDEARFPGVNLIDNRF